MSESVEEHYRRLLQLPAPWAVTKVTEDLATGAVRVQLAWPKRKKAPRPECGELCPVHDRIGERSWRHLSVMQYKLELSCALPRCRCPEHGVKTVRPPWAEPGSSFTLAYEAWAVQVMLACSSLTRACSLLGLHWESAQRVMRRAVERGMRRRSLEGLSRVGLDEKSYRKGRKYASVMTDLDEARVLEIVEGSKAKDAERLWEALPEERREGIVAAAMDMSGSYIAATGRQAPNAEIVHDRFHVSKNLNDAVDKTRRQESAALSREGDDTLKGSRYLWLHGTVPQRGRERFEQLLEVNLKTSRAWLYKEQMAEFWEHDTAEEGAEFFEMWRRSVMSSRLPEMKRVARALKERLSGLLSYFRHRISNAMTEGFNSVIQAIKADARGFTNFENFRCRILFHCGKLDLFPDGYGPLFHSRA